jgi:hypothetical protein
MHSRRHHSPRADRQPNAIDFDSGEAPRPERARSRAAHARAASTVAPRRPSVRDSASVWVRCLAAIGLLLAGCGLFRSAVNDSPNIRWWLFSTFGAERMCPEMLKRSAPLRLTNGGHVIGRLFPNACQHRIDEQRRTVSLEFTGTGYAWTPIAGRVGFSTHAGVEYRADFSLQDDSMYVWARTERLLFAPEFRVGSIENRLVDWAQNQSPVGYLANTFGAQITSSQLLSGFTVVRSDEGDAFALGILLPPERPRQPFGSGGEGRWLVDADTSEVRVEQIDFLGPIVVEESGRSLYFKYALTGPAAEALLWGRADADAWRERLQMGAPLTPPPAPAILGFALAPGAPQEQRVPLPPGQYVLVIDNSSRVGRVNPPWNPLLNAVGANPVVLSYRLELGETP